MRSLTPTEVALYAYARRKNNGLASGCSPGCTCTPCAATSRVVGLAGAQLGDLRSDLVGIFAAIYGKPRAEKIFSDLENMIRNRAEEGATTAVEKNHLKPLLIGALAVGGAASILSIIAIVRTRRR